MGKFLVLILIAICLSPLTALAADLEGVYDCQGNSPGGSAYQGTVSIIKNGENYTITWSIGTSIYVGIGILTGDILSVGYSDLKQNGVGIVAYKVQGHKLTGLWVTQGASKNGTENLTKKMID